MDSLFNRNTDGVTGNEGTDSNAMSQHAASTTSAAVVNPLYAAEAAGEGGTSTGSPVPASAPAADARAYVAEPALQQTVPAKEHEGKQPGRAANLLLVATLAAVCGLAGGLAGGAIMSAVTGGSTQTAQGGMGGQGGMQGGGMQDGGTPSANDTASNSEGTASGSAPSGQAPSGAPDASGSADGSTDGSNGAPGDVLADTSTNADTSQTSLSA